jgi:hypothetical protein
MGWDGIDFMRRRGKRERALQATEISEHLPCTVLVSMRRDQFDDVEEGSAKIPKHA